jgi:hypothetical protein
LNPEKEEEQNEEKNWGGGGGRGGGEKKRLLDDRKREIRGVFKRIQDLEVIIHLPNVGFETQQTRRWRWRR